MLHPRLDDEFSTVNIAPAASTSLASVRFYKNGAYLEGLPLGFQHAAGLSLWIISSASCTFFLAGPVLLVSSASVLESE